MVVMLGDVYLRVYGRNSSQNNKAQSGNNDGITANWRFHRQQFESGGALSTTMRCFLVKQYSNGCAGFEMGIVGNRFGCRLNSRGAGASARPCRASAGARPTKFVLNC